jgi:hypothetical protein
VCQSVCREHEPSVLCTGKTVAGKAAKPSVPFAHSLAPNRKASFGGWWVRGMGPTQQLHTKTKECFVKLILKYTKGVPGLLAMSVFLRADDGTDIPLPATSITQGVENGVHFVDVRLRIVEGDPRNKVELAFDDISTSA